MTAPSTIVVKKYGGTSVGSLERIENVAARLAEDLARGEMPIVVASAMSGETNRLVAMAEYIDPDYRGVAYDMLVASGEQVSIALLAIALQKRGIAAQPLLAYQLGIQTDNVYSKARILKIEGERLLDLCRRGIVPVVAGFQGIDEEENITTLGRGGSDTTAVALAAAIGARQCEIYTDVPAVCTADPRLVPGAKELTRVSFEEMMEMAALGSKVLHIRCVELAAKYGIRIHLRSTFEAREGTWIVPEGEVMENPLVTAVTHDANTFVFVLHPVPAGTDFLANLFDRLATRGVVVDIITQSDTGGGQRLAFSVTKEDVALTRQTLKEFLPPGVDVETMEGMGKISIVGVGMRNNFGVAARFFRVLADAKIPVQLVTTSEIKISAVISSEFLSTAAGQLADSFELRTADAGASNRG
ncbi:MAG: aspartate kinase [Bdellovibrionaceae bacterium]|nr:aspartate kinase [Pseudobdellovibrionaceae bacterium]